MQNNSLKEFVKYIEIIFNNGNPRFDYFIETDNELIIGFNPTKRTYTGNYDELEKVNEIDYDFVNYEYTISYAKYFNQKTNSKLNSAIEELRNQKTIHELKFYTEQLNILNRIKELQGLFLKIKQEVQKDSEPFTILKNIHDKLFTISCVLDVSLNNTNFGNKKEEPAEIRENEKFKIPVTITGEELGCLFRLLKEENLIVVKHKTVLKTARVITSAFSFPDKSNQSANSMKNAYTNCMTKDGTVDLKLLKDIKIRLLNIIALINKKIKTQQT